MKILALVSVLLLVMVLLGSPALAEVTGLHPEIVRFQGDDGQMLAGDFWKPEGKGPFPTLIWNHGSFVPGTPGGNEQKMLGKHEPLAKLYTKHGYAIFFPSRHGHIESPDYTGDMLEHYQELKSRHDTIALHEFWNLDVQAAIRYIRSRPDVDAKRLVVTGFSYGGIQTLLTAEHGSGMQAAICFSPGAMSWNNGKVRKRLLQAVRGATIPIFLLQAENDYTVGPSELFGPELSEKGPPNFSKIYPPYGTSHGEAHGGFAMNGEDIWGADVLNFLNRVLAKPDGRTAHTFGS